MALTNAEKVRRYRERQKAEQEASIKAPEGFAAALGTTPTISFDVWFSERDPNASNVNHALDLAGLSSLTFDTDEGGKAFTSSMQELVEDSDADLGKNALEWAEVRIGALLDAVTELATSVNQYKRLEITTRISAIEHAELTTPEQKREALAEMKRLTEMLDWLDKPVRRALPQWKAKGVKP